jgi:hypothetical protein
MDCSTTNAAAFCPCLFHNEAGGKYTVLFHGNCVDGLCCAAIAAYYLQAHCNPTMTFHAVCPSQPHTWPTAEAMAGTHILMLDVSAPADTRAAWLNAGAHCVNCVDHHETSKEHWVGVDCCPIDTDHCAAMMTHRLFYAEEETPAWLHAIDRIDRWDHPTFEDRCFREIMAGMAKLPVQGRTMEALVAFQGFMRDVEDPERLAGMLAAGRQSLEKKDSELFALLTAHGHIVDLTAELCAAWGLGPNWVGQRMALMNNTNFVVDTTEAAHLCFEYHPAKPTLFVNYRHRVVTRPVRKEMIVYYGRAKADSGFNLMEGSILRGHPTAAGATVFLGQPDTVLPFLL